MSLNWDIQTFERLGSTQDFAKEKAEQGAQEGLLVQALVQEQGRGRRGREWISAEGNLATSFVLRPECDVQKIGQISILIGVALAETVRSFMDAPVHLKWPNDVFLDGKKCAGILIDSDLDGQDVSWLVIGIGVNTAQAPEIGKALNVEKEEFFVEMLKNIERNYALWQSQGFEDIRARWIEASYPRGTMLNVGVFEDLDELGNLVVRDESGQLKTISAGDVFLKDSDYAAGN